jgi:DNA-binding NarL/FixJ family response regulator
MAGVVQTRVRADIARLADRNLSVSDYSRAATRALRRAVPFDGACVLTFDPATLLPTGEVLADDVLPPAAMARLVEIELGEPDYNKFATLARSGTRAASLSAATRGCLDRSLRQRELRRPSGFGDEMRAVLVDDLGTWGAVTLLREHGTKHFSAAEVHLVGELTRDLTDGLRRAVLAGTLANDGEDAPDTGVLVLAGDNSVEFANDAAERWLDELDVEGGSPGSLPRAIQAVAAGTRSAAGGEPRTTDAARARMQTRHGRWVNVHGSILGEGPSARMAVIIAAARADELAPLIADAYALTERERLVTQLVARGLSTSAIGRRLHLSPYTVQDHLKAIFEKTGTSSRGELVARLFFDHFAPRLSGGSG